MYVTMAGVKYECEACDQVGFQSRVDWLSHLDSELHSTKARENMQLLYLQSNGNMFVISEIGEVDKSAMLDYVARIPSFSNFVCFRPQANVCIMVCNAGDFATFAASPHVISGVQPKFRDYNEIPPAEWKSYFTQNQIEVKKEKEDHDSTKEEENSRVSKSTCYNNGANSTTGKRNGGDQGDDSAERGTKRPKLEAEEDQITEGSQLKLVSQLGRSTASSGFFNRQLEHLKNAMEIPDDQYNSTMNLICLLEQLFVGFETKNPQLKVTISPILSRNWALQLKYTEVTPPPLILIRRVDKQSSSSTATMPAFTNFTINEMLCDPERRKGLFSSLTRTFPEDKGNPTKGFWNAQEKMIFHFQEMDGSTHSPIWITGNKDLNPQFQIWTMIKYLCTFDPRCKPLLAVIYYWAMKNSIQIAESNERFGKCITNIPDPFGITWLVILFLCRKGLLPTPQLIKSRSENQCELRFKACGNIGIHEDPEFAQTWISGKNNVWENSEAFARDVFTLAAEFFMVHGTQLEKGIWIIYSENGDILGFNDAIGGHPDAGIKKAVRLFLEEQKKVQRRLYLTHPFSNDLRIYLNDSAEPFQAMLKTGQRLNEFLQAYSDAEPSGGNDEDFLNLLKI